MSLLQTLATLTNYVLLISATPQTAAYINSASFYIGRKWPIYLLKLMP
jgi:hypothetical protein